MTRIIIFTGKGGVGKTTVAAAHAWLSAAMGEETLLVSTDMAHNLSDLFERRIGREPVNVAAHLEAVELDPETIMREEFADLMRTLDNLLARAGGEGEDSVMLAGMEELFSLLKLLQMYESGRYDRIIVDCAPTGETLSLLKFPELLSWYMERFFPLGKAAMRVLAPISRKMFQLELPDRSAMNDIERLYGRLITLQEVLKDPETTSVRLVTLAEKMVVEETKRSYMYLNLYGYQVDGLYINRVLPPQADNAFFTEWHSLQRQYIAELEAVFADLTVTKIPWYETDLCGVGALERLCQDTLGDRDLFLLGRRVEHERYERTKDGYWLTLLLPEAQKEQLELYLSGSDLIVRLGNFKRSIPLPNVLRGAEVAEAKLEAGKLRIRLVQEARHDA